MATLRVIGEIALRPIPHKQMVGMWYHMRNVESKLKIRSEFNYQLGGLGEVRTESGWQQPEPYQVNWPKVAEFLNDLYARIGIPMHTSAEELELKHVSHG